MAYDQGSTPPKQGFQLSGLGKVGEALGTPNRLAVNLTLLPLLRSVNPQAYADLTSKVGQDRFGMTNAYTGDVLRAEFPMLNQTGFAGNALAMIGGLVGDTVLDPLSYVGLGGLTRAGKAGAVGLRGAAPLAETLGEQFAQGQRRLLQITHGPLSGVGPALPGEGLVWKGLDKVKEGRALSSSVSLLNHLKLNATPLVDKVKVVEDYWNRMLQDFGIPIATHPYLAQRTKTFLSTLQGKSMTRARSAVDTLGPDLEDFASDLARYYPNVKPQELKAKLGEVVTYMHELHPHLQLVRGSFVDRSVALPRNLNTYDREIHAITEVMGAPPSFGGPASPFDTTMLRGLRGISAKLLQANDAIYEEELKKLTRTFYLHTNPDAGYLTRLYSDEGNKFLQDRLEQVYQAPKGKSGRFPSSSHRMQLARQMRTVDPKILEAMRASGDLAPIQVKVWDRLLRKHVVREVDPYARFKEGVGQLIQTRDTFKVAALLEKERPHLSAQLEELFPTPSALEANAWVRDNGFKFDLGRNAGGKKIQLEVKPGEIQNLFATDPYQSLLARGVASDRAILSKEFFDELKLHPDLVLPKAQAPAGSMWQESLAPELDGFVMHPEAARWLNRSLEIERSYPKHIESMLKGFRWANKHFKFWSLAPFPSTITRNVVGDMWNYYVGATDGRQYVENLYRAKDAMGALYKHAGDTHIIKDPVNKIEYTAKEIYEKARDLNLWGSGVVTPYNQKSLTEQLQFARVFPIEPERQLLQGYKQSGALKRFKGVFPLPPEEARSLRGVFTPNTNNWYLNLGFHLNQVASNGIRMAHVIQKIREGHTIEAAVMSAKKHLFDYHDLSNVEKDVLREVFPFYAWSRKNFPNVLRTLVMTPDKAARLNSAVHGFTGYDTPEEERYLNSFLIDNFPTRIRKRPDGKYEYFVLKNWLPLADLQDLLDMRGWAQRSLTPMLKVPLEIISNTNWFTGRKIDQMNQSVWSNLTGSPGERSRMFGTLVPNRPVAHVLRSIRPIDFLHQWVDNPQDLSIMARVGRTLVGRVYPLDPQKSYDDLVRQLEVMDRDTQKSISSALFRHEPGEAQRLFLQGALNRQKELKKRGFQ